MYDGSLQLTYIHMINHYCSGESFVFKTKFTGWEGVLKEDYSIVKEKKSSERKALKVNQLCVIHSIIYCPSQVDLSPLFLPRQPPMSNRQAVSYHCY